MSNCLLWPITRWGDNNEFEREAAGPDVECIFCPGPESVTDEQWARADALISIPSHSRRA